MECSSGIWNSLTNSFDGDDQCSPFLKVQRAHSHEKFGTFGDPSQQFGHVEIVTDERVNRGQQKDELPAHNDTLALIGDENDADIFDVTESFVFFGHVKR